MPWKECERLRSVKGLLKLLLNSSGKLSMANY